MTYPDKRLEYIIDGKQNYFVTTDGFKQIAEEESKMKLDWFFEAHLRKPKLPKLISETTIGKLSLCWNTPNNLSFPMPIDIEINGKKKRINMKNCKGEIKIANGVLPMADSNGWVLRTK